MANTIEITHIDNTLLLLYPTPNDFNVPFLL